MSKLTQYQEDALLVLRTRLNPHDPCNTASDEVKAHLRAIVPWLDTWVVPHLDTIDSSASSAQRWLREKTEDEARHIRLRQAERKAPGA